MLTFVSASQVAAVVTVATCGSFEPSDTTLVEGETGQRIADIIQRAEQRSGFSGAVLAARDGRVIAAVAVGLACEDESIPNTPDTLFEVASVTKQFTAAAIMQLVGDGKLSLSDSIADHLPDVPDNCHSITVEHLLRHTSGIPGTNTQGAGDDVTKVLPTFLRDGPVHEPGSHWGYWNQGYALLSEIIRNVAEMSYTDYCRDALFRKAEMHFTGFTGDDPSHDAAVAIGISAFGPPRSAFEHPYGSYGFQYRGMGGVVTTVWDLWRWDRALHGTEILNDEAKVALFSPGLNDYALGWFVRTDSRGSVVQSHGGAVRGFSCELRRYPDKDALLVVLSNRDDAPLRQLVPVLETILFDGDPAEGQPLGRLDDRVTELLVGKYRDDLGNEFVVEPGLVLDDARIKWSPPYGPITRAQIGLDTEGVLTLFDGADLIAVNIEQSDESPVSRLEILGRTFRRIQ